EQAFERAVVALVRRGDAEADHACGHHGECQETWHEEVGRIGGDSAEEDHQHHRYDDCDEQTFCAPQRQDEFNAELREEGLHYVSLVILRRNDPFGFAQDRLRIWCLRSGLESRILRMLRMTDIAETN